LIVGITLLFVGISIVPSTNGGIEKKYSFSTVQINDEKSMNVDKTVPDCVMIGDLMLLDLKCDESNPWKRPGPYNEHCAIYVGDNTLVDATYPFVREKNYSHFYYNWQKNLVFVRVKTATETQRQAAADWARSQIGLPYQVFFDVPWFGLKIANTNLRFPTAHELYCMELPWIAYYIEGIDIDYNAWKIPLWVTGDDIIHDDDIEIIYTEVDNSTEFTKPYKGIYVANTKIAFTLNKTIIFGNIDIEVITYNELIAHVDFYIDNVYRATDSTLPFSWRWDEPGSGRKVIKVIACDDVGNEYSSAIIVWKFI
jgi:hypothetical protein